ncbi:MAG TPA: hypothetical protein VKJ01_18460, partial [Candidatus Solibacter sp.]|nr:hypothetical protein [Candidatus Solibacter sp.]
MPDISITDELGKPVEGVTVDLESPSSIFNYLKARVFHLIVLPELLARKDDTLTQAAPQPIQFQAKVGNTFQLGTTEPAISFSAGVQATIRVNTTPGSSLFDQDAFVVKAAVPAATGYVSTAFTGTTGAGLSASSGLAGLAGDLTFGFAGSAQVAIEYLKAFPTGAGEPTLATALGSLISTYVIPASVADLKRLELNDVCTASGTGSLKISGSFNVVVPVNPLASVNLPLGAGTIAVKDGAMAGVAASAAIIGSYQIRARRIAPDTIELSYLKQKGATLKADLSASAGVSVTFGGTDLLSALLGAIGTDPTANQKLFDGLAPAEIRTLTAAIKSGVDHSLRAGLDLALAAVADDEAAFQYLIDPERLDATSNTAVERALRGDLSELGALEANLQADGTIAPGVKVVNSAFLRMRKTEVSLRVNLLGIVNLLSLSNLIRNGEAIGDPVSGDLTFKETLTGNIVSAIAHPYDRQTALRKALFDSVMVTTVYRAGKAVTPFNMNCHHVHFALQQDTGIATLSEYLNWFIALNLIDQAGKAQSMKTFTGGGPSSCLLRTEFDDAASSAMFLDGHGNPRPEKDYLDIARQALRAVLDPANSDIARYRCTMLDDPIWPAVLATGASAELGPLLPIPSTHAQYALVLQVVIGDLYDIQWWAGSMHAAGRELQAMRAFLASNPNPLAHNAEFEGHKENLQKLMAKVIGASKMRFDDPFGMVSLFWAA